jgi:hypothetical protein
MFKHRQMRGLIIDMLARTLFNVTTWNMVEMTICVNIAFVKPFPRTVSIFLEGKSKSKINLTLRLIS